MGSPWLFLGRAMGSSRWEIPCGKGMRLFLTSCTVCFQPQAQQTATIIPTQPPTPLPDMQTAPEPCLVYLKHIYRQK